MSEANQQTAATETKEGLQSKGVTTLWVVGLLSIASYLGKPNPTGIPMGLVFLFGSLAVKARQKRQSAGSIWWLIGEIVALLYIALHILLSLTNDNWYAHPLPFMIAPILVVVAYGLAWKQVRKTQKVVPVV